MSRAIGSGRSSWPRCSTSAQAARAISARSLTATNALWRRAASASTSSAASSSRASNGPNCFSPAEPLSRSWMMSTPPASAASANAARSPRSRRASVHRYSDADASRASRSWGWCTPARVMWGVDTGVPGTGTEDEAAVVGRVALHFRHRPLVVLRPPSKRCGVARATPATPAVVDDRERQADQGRSHLPSLPPRGSAASSAPARSRASRAPPRTSPDPCRSSAASATRSGARSASARRRARASSRRPAAPAGAASRCASTAADCPSFACRARLQAAFLVAVVVEDRMLRRQQPFALVRRGHASSSRTRTPRGSRSCRRDPRRPPRSRTPRRTVRRRASRTSRRRSASPRRSTRPGPDSASTNGPLALAVFTNTTRFDFSLRQQRLEVLRRHVGPGQVELRDLVRVGAVAEEHDRRPCRRRAAFAASVPNALTHAVARRRRVGQQRDVVLRHAQLLRRGVGERRPPLLEQLAVLRIARAARRRSAGASTARTPPPARRHSASSIEPMRHV